MQHEPQSEQPTSVELKSTEVEGSVDLKSTEVQGSVELKSTEVDEPPVLEPDDHRVAVTPLGIIEGYHAKGAWWIAMRRTCNEIDLDWSGQHRRIQRDPIMRSGLAMLRLHSGHGVRETVCLRWDVWWLWLFTIDRGRVNKQLSAQLADIVAVGYEGLLALLTGSAPTAATSQAPAQIPAPADAGLAAQLAQLQAQVDQLARQTRPGGRRWDDDGTPGGRVARADGTETAPWLTPEAIYAVFRQQPYPDALLGPRFIHQMLTRAGWDVGYEQVRIYMNRLGHAGLLRWPRQGQYGLPATETPPAE